jgi:hypothetical protein
MSIGVELARKEWEEGDQRVLAESRDPVRSEILAAQVEAVTDELRRRVGQTFTIAQLAAVYDTAEAWAREAVAERVPAPGWARTLTMVEGAAFHRYARGAVDYVP